MIWLGCCLIEGGQKSLHINVLKKKCKGTVGDGLVMLEERAFIGREKSKCKIPGIV